MLDHFQVNNMSVIRTFIAINIPQDILSNLEQIQTELKQTKCRVGWVKTKNIHLTLKFLGDTNEELIDEVEGKLQEIVINFTEIYKIFLK